MSEVVVVERVVELVVVVVVVVPELDDVDALPEVVDTVAAILINDKNMAGGL